MICGADIGDTPNPTLAQLHEVESERDALADEVRRLQAANRGLAAENQRWQVLFGRRVREAVAYVKRVDAKQKSHWARYYRP